MTEQRQFEEMVKVMPEKIKDPLDNSRYILFGKSLRREIARIYYNAGYRKADEVRKETAEDILSELVGHTFEDDGWTWTVSKEDVQWLAEKYEVKIKE